MAFSDTLIHWYEDNGRQLPWRGIDDPYRIWLSEIILQQTRIEQGMSYYQHFVTTYPTVFHLAGASEEQVLKSWQGLGYYSRARNLHAAAQQIVDQFNGIFPSTYKDILALKGVGRYTAAAIASFAFRLPYPVIDGNVYRAVARLFDIATPIATNTAYNEFEALLLNLIDSERPDLFNHAIMDFGSVQCKPQNPNCQECVFADSCMALRRGKVGLLPVKSAPTRVKDRYFYYFDIIIKDKSGRCSRLMHQREGNDIWRGLYELPLLETAQPLSKKDQPKTFSQFLATKGITEDVSPFFVVQYTHQLTHRTIHADFFRVEVDHFSLPEDCKELFVAVEETKKMPVSRLIDRYLLLF
ncbi:MAG: A/G-specific adenine glycosylase [Bacteroidales bacterium]|nr:A/G-specific adenine glycosylase [Bacteroidales bacterium]